MSGYMNELPMDWREALSDYVDEGRLSELEAFVESEYAHGIVYPPRGQLFRAFQATPYHDVKVVILGQDPYHEKGQACGLAFSVPIGERCPASLRNIYKEYNADLGYLIPGDGDLEAWSRRGVLMVNTVLSVREGAAGSHQGHGWEEFTDGAIRALSRREKPVVFLLWGKPAEKKERLIDVSRHVVIKSAHPSPLSAYRGFFGSRPFSRVNEALIAKGLEPVDWRLG